MDFTIVVNSFEEYIVVHRQTVTVINYTTKARNITDLVKIQTKNLATHHADNKLTIESLTIEIIKYVVAQKYL